MILLEMVLGWFGATIAILFWLVTAIATWRVFEKAGISGWKSLIPLYREYLLFRIAWDTKQFRYYLLAMAVSAIFEPLADKAGAMSIYGTIGAIVNIIVIYYEVMMKMKLAHAFDRSRAFGLFLYFLEPFGMMSLGYGPYDYIGPM